MSYTTTTTTTVSIKKNAVLRFACEACGKLCVTVTPVTVTGSASRSGYVTREATKERMRSEARDKGQANVYRVFGALAQAPENAALHGITLKGQCSFCKTEQSWVMGIGRARKIREFTLIGAVLLAFVGVILIGVQASAKQPIFTVPFCILIACVLAMVAVHLILPRSMVSAITKRLDGLDKQSRPTLLNNEKDVIEALKLIAEQKAGAALE